MNKRIYLLGDPVEQSLSPVFQNAALEAAGLPWRYESRRVGADELKDVLDGYRDADVAGANVTVPHKVRACGCMDVLEREASITGAVNTVHVRDGQLRGTNTDVPGFLAALEEVLPEGPSRPGALILGAGGGARSVAWGLVQRELVESVSIVSRNVENGQLLINAVREGQSRLGGSSVAFTLHGGVGDIANDQLSKIGLVVNATPLGMGALADETPLPGIESLAPDTFIFDLVYGRGKTRLLREADGHGLGTADGLGMLLHQGAISFSIWTGEEAPIEVMREALRREMTAKAAEQQREG